MDSTNGAIDESFVDIEIKPALTDAKPKGRARGGRVGLEKADSVIDDITFTLPGDPFAPIGVQQALKSSRWLFGRQVRETPPTAPVAPEFMPLAEIRTELPERVRKRQPVVPHPKESEHVTFVSSDNKAALVQGEVLSDEDDAVDEAHLDLARSTQMMEQISDPNARNFLLDLNAHIESEGIQGDKYLGPCLWRWLHKRQAWLKDTAVAQMFEALVWEAYNSKNYISAEVYKACMDKSQSIQNDRAGSNDEPAPPKEEVVVKRGKDSCSCGQEVLGVRDRVICANRRCEHPSYHKSCMLQASPFAGSSVLPQSWYCFTCLERIRKAFNGVNQATSDEHWVLPATRDLNQPAGDQEEAKEYWKGILEKHGMPLANGRG